MPIYEYRCRECGREFDQLHRSAGEGPPACPACGAPAATRLISLIAGLSPGGPNGGPVASGGGCACGGACACGR